MKAEEYTAWFDFIEFLNKLDDGRLAWATFAHKGNILSFMNFEGKIIDGNSLGRWILESHIPKLNISLDLDILPNRLID